MTKLPPPRAIDIEILAMTLWAEAADKPVRAIEALAALVMNRLRQGRDPNARHIAAICRAPFLFSCWNKRDPRHAALRAIPPGGPAMRLSRSVGASRNAPLPACCRTRLGVLRFGMMRRICPPGQWGKRALRKSVIFVSIVPRISPRRRHAPRARCWFWLKQSETHPARTTSRGAVFTSASSPSRCQAPLIRISLGRKRAL